MSRASASFVLLVGLFVVPAAAQPGQQAPAKPQAQGQSPPKKKVQASANFAQYAGRDASNRLIAGGATRDLLSEAERFNREGRESYEAGKYEEAAAAFRKLTELRPDSAVAFYSLGVALEAGAHAKEAAEAYLKAAGLTNDSALKAVSLYNLGNVRAAAGEPREAAEAYRKVLALAPREPVAHYNLGLALAAAGQLDEAVSSFKEAVRLKPDFADAHFNLGITLGRLERYEGAVGSFKEAVRLKPGHAEAHFNLGLAQLALGDEPAARAEVETLQTLKPELAARLQALSQ